MLRFSDPMREQSFTRKRSGSLRSNSLKLYCICLFVSSSSWVLSGFDTRTSAEAFTDGVDADLVLFRNLIVLCFTLCLIFGIFVFSSRRVANCVGPRGMELFVAVCETFVVLSLYVTSPWYITKIHGVDSWVAEWS